MKGYKAFLPSMMTQHVDDSKAAITSMPYFDAEKFFICTGIKVNGTDKDAN